LHRGGLDESIPGQVALEGGRESEVREGVH
jgi:hypothetical protein